MALPLSPNQPAPKSMALRRQLRQKQRHASNDAVFAGYVEHYKNLDTILWQHTATYIAVAGFGINGAIQVVHNNNSLFTLSAHSTSGIILIAVSIICSSIVYTMSRIRWHQDFIENFIADLEPFDGYFCFRLRRNRRQSASLWTQNFLLFFTVLCAIGGVAELNLGDWLWAHHSPPK